MLHQRSRTVSTVKQTWIARTRPRTACSITHQTSSLHHPSYGPYSGADAGPYSGADAGSHPGADGSAVPCADAGPYPGSDSGE